MLISARVRPPTHPSDGMHALNTSASVGSYKVNSQGTQCIMKTTIALASRAMMLRQLPPREASPAIGARLSFDAWAPGPRCAGNSDLGGHRLGVPGTGGGLSRALK